MISPAAELAGTLRLLNVEYRRLPDPAQVDLDRPELLDLETRISATMKTGDDPTARSLIREWRAAHLANFERHRKTA